MNITKKIGLFIAFLCFLITGFIMAMPNGEPQGRDQIRENIITLRMLRMTQVLNLTEDQAAKIFPFMNSSEKEKLGFFREINSSMNDLRLALRQEPPKLEEIESHLASIKKLREQIREKDEAFERFLEANLTTVQKGKYILFSSEFNRRLSENLERVRGMRKKLPEEKRK